MAVGPLQSGATDDTSSGDSRNLLSLPASKTKLWGMDTHSFMNYALVYLGVAVVAVPIFQRLGLGSVLGYLAGGWLIGPWGLKVITDPARIMGFAELGVVFLLFLIGLELSPRRLWVMRKAVFGLGSAQVGFTTLVIGAIAWACGLSMTSSLIIGAALSLSSTAFALQIMGEKKQLNTPFGRKAFGILLFQDLAAIPLLAIIPLLAPTVSVDSGSGWMGFVKVFGTLAILVAAGPYVLHQIFRLVAKANMREIFTAAGLLLILGIALVMETIGVSMALGSFLAGLLVAESEHRHELEADIEPFKGLLLGLFFISVGTSVDYGLAIAQPLKVLTLVAALLVIKAGVLFAIGRLSGLKNQPSRCLALTIPQGGEFAFVVFGVAVSSQLLEKSVSDILTLVVTVSMAVTPILIAISERWGSVLFKKEKAPFDQIKDESNPVVIAGLGRFGQITSRVLRVRNIGFTALDADQNQVDVLRRFGNKVYYGDVTRLELLHAAGVDKAKIFVLAIDQIEASLKCAELLRQHFPHVKIYARARNRQHAYDLMAMGVTHVHREVFGTSLDMTHDVLVGLGFSRDDADHTMTRFRKHDEEMLSKQFEVRNDEKSLIQFSKQYAQQLADLFQSDKPI